MPDEPSLLQRIDSARLRIHALRRETGALPEEMQARFRAAVSGAADSLAELAQAVDALRERDEWLRLVVGQMPAVVWTTDAELRITSSLGSALASVGHEPDEVVGQTLFELFHTSDPANPLVTAHRRALNGESVTYEDVWQGRWFEAHVEPLRDAGGRIIGALGVALDVSERARAESALQESEERLRTLFDGVPIGLYRTTPDGQVLDVNPALVRILGYPDREALQSVHVAETYTSRADRRRFVAAAEQAGVVRGFEVQLRRFDGSAIWARLSTRAVRGRDGRILYYEGGLEDITERKRLEEEVLRISEAERRRIGRDLHDSVGQNLTSVMLALGTLRRKLASRSAPEADDVERALALTQQVTDQVRGLARGLCPVALDAHGLVAALRALARKVDASGDVACRFQCAEAVAIQDNTLAVQLYRIAQEAVSNALRHARCSRLTLRLAARGEQMALTIEDDGVGIPARGRHGGGLGLRIMDYRARTIGGTLTIEPGAGRGTVVTCAFPRQRAREGGTDAGEI